MKMDDNLLRAAKLAQWLITKRKVKRNVAEIIAANKYKAPRNLISKARQILKPKQMGLI